MIFERRKTVTSQVEKYGEKFEKLLAFCEEARSLQEMMQCLGLTDRKHFRRHYLKPLLEAGKISMTMPDKPKSSRQKYLAAT